MRRTIEGEGEGEGEKGEEGVFDWGTMANRPTRTSDSAMSWTATATIRTTTMRTKLMPHCCTAYYSDGWGAMKVNHISSAFVHNLLKWKQALCDPALPCLAPPQPTPPT